MSCPAPYPRVTPLSAMLMLLLSPIASGAETDPDTRDDPTVTLEQVEATGTATGLKPEDATTTGPWGNRRILDTPYSITVLRDELIESVSAQNLDQLFQLAPQVQAGQSQDINNIAQATLRGFNVARAYLNGVQNNSLGMGVFVEEIGQLEIFNGLSGFLFGPSPVGGVINYQLKRPTGDNLRSVTIGNYGGQQYFVHADLGGTVDSQGRFRYRLNLLKQDGDTPIDDQQLERGMVSASMAWDPTQATMLELYHSNKDYRLDGRQFQFYLGTEVPDPWDGSRLHGPRDTFVDVDTEETHLTATYQPTPAFSIRSAYQRKQDTRAMVYTLGGLLPNRTQYELMLLGGTNAALNEGGYVYLDYAVSAGSVRHKLTAGINGYDYQNRLAILSNGLPSYFTPTVVVDIGDRSVVDMAVPDWDLDDARWVVSGKSRNVNLVAGDEIVFDDRWTLMLGASRSSIRSENFDFATGAPIPGSLYDKTATTPTASILYRPGSQTTLYATYIESLEQGAIVGPTYANADQILEPLVSRQYELGAKTSVDGMLLTAALFQIDKANERSDDGTPTGTYVQDGRQVHRGLELSAAGSLTDEVGILAGLTLMDNEIRRSGDPSLEGKRPTWVFARTFKVFAEYSPAALPGLGITAGAYFNGDGYQDPMNTRKIPGYNLLDFGVRYQAPFFGRDTIARLNLTNATDERYWAATSPGAPRKLAFTVSTRF